MQIFLNNRKSNDDTNLNFGGEIDPTQRAWIEVSGKAIEANVRQLISKLKNNCEFMAVVKADGYGHDAKIVSQNAIKGGATQLGVATLKEGIKLRSFGINVPILILGNLYAKKDLLICFRNNLMPTVSTIRECLICNNIGKNNNFKFSLHLKVDTGMSRLGFEYDHFVKQYNNIKSLENIAIKGILQYFQEI